MEESAIIGDTLNVLLQAASQKMTEDDMLEFGKLRTDRDRVEFVLQQDHIHEMVVLEPEFHAKSTEKAKKFKESGNEYFGKKSFVSALKEYNKSIRFCSKDDAEGKAMVAVLFANRSASLLHLRRFEKCLMDIELAIDEGYPKDAHYKLFDRKGKCFIQMKKPGQAIEAFQRAKELLSDSKLDEKGRENWTKTLAKEIQQCDKVHQESKDNMPENIPKVSGVPNKTYPSVSQAINFAYNNDHGRHAAAQSNIRVGDVLGCETPYASVLLPPFYHTHCYHCMMQTHEPIPCFKTSSLAFCSMECRQTAWDEYFHLEYRYLHLLGPEYCAKIGHLAVRLALKLGIETMRKRFSGKEDTIQPMQKGLTADGIYPNGYDSICCMETNMSRRIPEGLYDFTIFAVCLLKLLQGTGFFDKVQGMDNKEMNNETLLVVGTALLRHLEVIQCNGTGVMELQEPGEFDNSTPADVGIAIYPTIALFNHSCDPNADLNFFDSRVVVRATRNISKGEGVNIDYGMVFYKNPIRERQGKLQYRYCFDCRCVACREEWRLWRDLESEIPNFRCDNCGRALVLGGKLIENAYVRCEKCNNLQNIQEPLNRLQISHEIFAAAMNEAVSGHMDKALPDLCRHLSLMQTVLLPPWKDLVSCQAAVRQCYRVMANTRDII